VAEAPQNRPPENYTLFGDILRVPRHDGTCIQTNKTRRGEIRRGKLRIGTRENLAIIVAVGKGRGAAEHRFKFIVG